MPPKRSRNAGKRARGANQKPASTAERETVKTVEAAAPQVPIAIPCDRVTRSMAVRGLGTVSEPPKEVSVPSRQPARPRKRIVVRKSEDSRCLATKPATLKRKLSGWEGKFRRGRGIIENSPPPDEETPTAEGRERLALRLAAVNAIKKRHEDESIESLGSISSLSNTPQRGSKYIWWMDNLRRNSVLEVSTAEESQTWYAFLGDVFWKGKPVSEYTAGEAILMRYLIEKEVLIPCAINMGELKTRCKKEGRTLSEFQICSELSRKRKRSDEEDEEEEQSLKRVKSSDDDAQSGEFANREPSSAPSQARNRFSAAVNSTSLITLHTANSRQLLPEFFNSGHSDSVPEDDIKPSYFRREDSCSLSEAKRPVREVKALQLKLCDEKRARRPTQRIRHRSV
ncbi:hypothetical protein TWF694_009609 [Orbilia ellipsospora]|uniref:Uncharacterized protein n=1 Tax=Orbilia ellipsospora TaxID=2528407 RepID=A0AAV9XE12_9PEZI